MIILEGPDRCGKTTLARALLRRLPGWGYRHHTKPPVPPLEYFGWVSEARATTIIDRLHWSELVYGTVYRNQARLSPGEWRLLEMILLAQRATIVRLTDDVAKIQARYDHKEMYSADRVPELVRHYDALAGGGASAYLTAVDCFTFHLPDLVTEHGQLTVDGEALAMAADRNVCEGGPPPSAGIGYLGPGGWVLIGEAPNYEALMDPTYRGPRVPWGRGRSTEYLWQALDQAGVDWRRGYLTNADYLASLDVRTWARSRAPKAIVTVGFQAKELATEHRLHQVAEVTHLAHPSFEQRFKRAQFNEYSERLGLALREFILPSHLRMPQRIEVDP